MKKMLVAVLALATLTGCAGKDQKSEASGTNAVKLDQRLHDSLPQAVRDRGYIRFVTDASYAPMESFAPDGRTIVGFEPDLADAIGQILGIKVQIVTGPFQTALDRVVDGTYEGVLSAMTDTVEREKKADFVDYFQAGTSIVVQRGNPQGVTDLDDLCGRVVAVERGTVQADLLNRSQHSCDKKIIIHDLRTNDDAWLQLRQGKAIAVLNDYPPAAYLAGDVRTRAFYQLASTVQYEPGLFGIAVAKTNGELRDALRQALDRLIRSGAYTELLQRWNLIGGGLAVTSVNAGSGATPGS